MPQLKEFRAILSEEKGQRKQIQSDLDQTKIDIELLKEDIRFTQIARAIIQKVASETQKQLEYHISELVSLAMSGIFPNPYEFEVEFREHRGRTECQMNFKRNGQKVDPLMGGGGGPLDVASFALIPTVWSLKPTRNFLALDEPFKYLSRDLQPKASEMLKEISKRLGLQVLMVTHSPDLIEGADKIFKTSIKDGITEVSEDV